MLTRLVLAVAILFTLGPVSSYAKIWRVNNNPGVNANFTTLQAAHDSARAGDTIHVEGSPITYAGFTCSKQLVVIGTGYFLDQNENSQALTQSSKVNNVQVNAGSAGSVFTGLDFANNDLNIYCNDIVIKRNNFGGPNGADGDYYTGRIYLGYISNAYPTAVSNIIITQNHGMRIWADYPSTGILITNNYISYYSYTGDNTTAESVRFNANAVALFQNNIFRRGTITVSNSSFTNNIMVNGFMGTGTGNLMANNLASGSQFGNTNGNQENIDMTTVFLGFTGTSYDEQWKLKAGSPAIGAGYGSTSANPIDAGIYGGSTPYMVAGLPSVPAIYFFENQPIGSNADPIDVNLKVKSVGN